MVDSGLLCHLLRLDSKEELLLSRHKGAVVETFAVAELLKHRMNLGKKPNLTFYRDSKVFEVDTIADWKHTFAIEIKSSHAPEAKLSWNTKKYLELRGDENAKNAVFYLGDISKKINGTSYVSWKEFMIVGLCKLWSAIAVGFHQAHQHLARRLLRGS